MSTIKIHQIGIDHTTPCGCMWVRVYVCGRPAGHLLATCIDISRTMLPLKLELLLPPLLLLLLLSRYLCCHSNVRVFGCLGNLMWVSGVSECVCECVLEWDACSFMQVVGGLLAEWPAYVTLMRCCPTTVECEPR